MLLKDLAGAQVLDARRPKFGVEMQPVIAPVPVVKPASSTLSLPIGPRIALS
jgi:hypothetical protein